MGASTGPPSPRASSTLDILVAPSRFSHGLSADVAERRLTSVGSRGGPFLVGERMEHIDRIANVETLALPGWSGGPWVHRDPGRIVVHPHRAHGVGWRRRRTRHIGHDPTIRVVKSQLTIGRALDPIAFVVDRAMMTPAEQHQIRLCRRAAVGPVADVMRLAEAPVAAREATAAIAIEERPSQRRRDRARLGADVEDTPVTIVLHHHPARVAAKALGRFRGTQHVASATPRPAETQYAAGVREAEVARVSGVIRTRRGT